MARRKPRKPDKKSQLIPLIIFLTGLFLILSSVAVKNLYANRLSFNGVYVNSSTKEGKIVPVKLHIPKIDVTFPVHKTRIINGTWQIADNGASYLENSSGIGEKQSTVIYNHNTTGKFENLYKLKQGDTIILEGSDKKIHVYKVKDTKIVDPSDVEILTEDSSENLILYTCYGFADLKRFVVKAIPTS